MYKCFILFLKFKLYDFNVNINLFQVEFYLFLIFKNLFYLQFQLIFYFNNFIFDLIFKYINVYVFKKFF